MIPGQTARILVADDAPITSEMIEHILRGSGFEVATASDGFEAVQQALQHKFDLVLTDVVMPQLNGCEVRRQLWETPLNKDTPVIFVTGWWRQGAEAKVTETFGKDTTVIRKPFKSKDLLRIVEQQLGVLAN